MWNVPHASACQRTDNQQAQIVQRAREFAGMSTTMMSRLDRAKRFIIPTVFVNDIVKIPYMLIIILDNTQTSK
jgi:hypothetical protein